MAMAEPLVPVLRSIASAIQRQLSVGPADANRIMEAADRLERLASAEAMAVSPDYYADNPLWPELQARMCYAEAGQADVAAAGNQDAD